SPLIAEDFEPEPELEPIATKPPQAHNPASALPADASELAAHRPASAGSFAVGRLGVGLLFGVVLGAPAGGGGGLRLPGGGGGRRGGGFGGGPGGGARHPAPARPIRAPQASRLAGRRGRPGAAGSPAPDLRP